MRTGVLCLLALAGPLWAAPPVVPPPVRAAVGEDVQVDVVVEAGKVGAYGLGFDGADCLFFRGYSTDPTKMTFLARAKKAGKFYVVFWTVGEEASSRFLLEAVGGPTPPQPPTPEPVPPPDAGVMGLARASREGAAAVNLQPAPKATQARALADTQRQMAAYASQQTATGDALAANVLSKWRQANNATVSAADWRPWSDRVGAQLQSVYAAGKLKAGRDWSQAFLEMAYGLENP